MGAIQAFEISYELVWKTLQKILNQQGVEARSPRETFRLSAQFGYLDNPQTWIDFGQERNLTSHAYREEVLHELLNLLPQFIPELTKIITNLQTRKD
jgi:nucleotidyltransferase substrate binding protein (TIGR01987 family)